MDNAAGPRFARREWAETADASGTCSEAVCICGLHPLTIGGRRPPPGSVLVKPLPLRAAPVPCSWCHAILVFGTQLKVSERLEGQGGHEGDTCRIQERPIFVGMSHERSDFNDSC